MTQQTASRRELTIDGRRISYLDHGPATGRPLLALHGHLSEGSSFDDLAVELGPEWRVIAPDQRGHGDSDRADDYGREGYVSDLTALLDHLGTGPVVALGHSLGGINALYLAAARPAAVTALVNTDSPVALPHQDPGPLAFLTGFPYTAPTREQLIAACGPVGPMVGPLLRPLPDGDGWRLPFHPQDTLDSERQVHGDHWAQWLASDCPALVINGRTSQALPAEQAASMASLRPRTSLVTLETDHFVQLQDPKGFARAVREFLVTL
ncbi:MULTISPECIES: alpha/beta fold hydrolase [Streptomyces]|uniref:Alpha/beta hydrolase n=1 Tax=Streptomyces poriferorum TaxID=2798799 RepID=A0ABY9IQR0_9ACTN|nr:MULTISPECIES: alpha/beta hydrolase [Streptomyces]MBW5248540.1 alpha/beta hydrolase [Streptomyces poriferorum]MBW5260200.1 alpha/beta hydrolase [Streptomyces poriferorum]MDP5313573.1 alpha/beta hydrolase [Streptomyces sp. Alt4]WLQ57460.1 alpha/beta hydrolase [Streptomyces sp. Alt2]WSI64671.1 alpha/beta hydrolase [Streptomyces sp. NBC_01336]